MLTPRDLAALNAYECLDSGLYRRRILPVCRGGRHEPALVYIARDSRPGRSCPGYQTLVVAAARDWQLPPRYVRGLAAFSRSRLMGRRAPETGETRG